MRKAKKNSIYSNLFRELAAYLEKLNGFKIKNSYLHVTYIKRAL